MVLSPNFDTLILLQVVSQFLLPWLVTVGIHPLELRKDHRGWSLLYKKRGTDRPPHRPLWFHHLFRAVPESSNILQSSHRSPWGRFLTAYIFVVVQLLSCVHLFATPQTDSKDCSTLGSSVLHYLLGFAQTLVHWVSDAIQSSHPLLPPSPFAFNLSQHQGLIHWVSFSHQVAKVLELQLQHQSFQWIFRVEFL